jgi:hypothetical protein
MQDKERHIDMDPRSGRSVAADREKSPKCQAPDVSLDPDAREPRILASPYHTFLSNSDSPDEAPACPSAHGHWLCALQTFGA